MTQDPPLISTRRDGLPKTLDPVLAAALSKQPEDRPPNCRALVSGVRDAFRAREGVQGSAPRTVRPTAPRRSGAASASRSKPAEGEASRPQISQGLTAATTSARGGQGAAGKRGATAGAGGGRRPHLRLGALLLTLVLAVGLGSWWAVDRYWGWTAYSGREFEEAGVALEHPRTWVVRSHPGQFAVISPDDLTPVFTPSSSWATVERVAASDPDRLVGAYVNSTGWLNLGNALDPLGNQLKTRFSTSAKIEVDNRLPSGAPAGAQGVVGTMTPPDGSAAPRLYFEFVAIKTGGREGLVLLFCLEDQRAAQASTFERVLQSVRLP